MKRWAAHKKQFRFFGFFLQRAALLCVEGDAKMCLNTRDKTTLRWVEEKTQRRGVRKKACARQKGNKYKKDKNEAQKTSSNSPSVAPTLSPTHGITIKSFVLFLQIFFRIADLQKKGKEGAERDSREMSKREEERKKGKRNGKTWN